MTTLRRKEVPPHGSVHADDAPQHGPTLSTSRIIEKNEKHILPSRLFWVILVAVFITTSNLFKSVSIKENSVSIKENSIRDGNNNAAAGEPRLQRVPPTLDYGVELSYLLPMEILEQVKGTNDMEVFETLHRQTVERVVLALQKRSVKAGIIGHRVSAPNTWAISTERTGCELASYISPPREEIKRIMEVFNESHFQIDAEMNAFHINIDARNAVGSVLTSSRGFASGSAVSVGKQYKSIANAYKAMEDPEQFPYPSFNRRTLRNGTMIKDRSSRSVLCLTMNHATNTTQSFEFRGIQASLDPNVIWTWVQFAQKFVSVSYAGKVLEPLPRTTAQQWEALFGTLIEDDKIEASLREWRDAMRIKNPNRVAAIEAICPFLPGRTCRSAKRGLGKRQRRERRRERQTERKKGGVNDTSGESMGEIRAQRRARRRGG
jgi:hypothetical protein